ncbi:sensor histidine kinase [Egibacter rhizosphaerae]|uniref:Sensor histidine kinase n=1 Tax=Egibacter rhizosphaerae TaxID=1670831 RepID=A0A411YCW2_9ACTN|nr:sensor histidine kinase [Egibacter rhizosphaerae]QBI19071.1 sensor histidine kinase [Egibacter rhizosphaerae]
MNEAGVNVLQHDAFLYRSDREFGETLEPFVRAGLEEREPVLAVTRQSNIAQLRECLGADAERVTFADSAEFYRHPTRTIEGYHRALEGRLHAGAARVRVIGEVPFEGSESERREWVRYEAALNHVFADRPVWIVCPYDLRVLPADLVRDAARTHPWVQHDGRRSPSDRYEDPARVVQEVVDGSSLPEHATTELEVDGELSSARAVVREFGLRHGVDSDVSEQFTMAVNEALTNAFQHGRPPVWLRLYADEPTTVSCEIHDAGGQLLDPLAGYAPPSSVDGHLAEAGMGLWLARSLCDRVELVPYRDATVLRLVKRVR